MTATRGPAPATGPVPRPGRAIDSPAAAQRGHEAGGETDGYGYDGYSERARAAGWRARLSRWDAADARDRRLARALGWFSIGLGLAQTGAPRRFARLIGAPEHGRGLAALRAVGVRELFAGAGVLSRRRPAGWLWARLAGDALDFVLLGAALRSPRAAPGRLAGAIAAVAGVTALDAYDGWRLTRRNQDAQAQTGQAAAVDAEQAITVNRPPEEVYRFWHDFQNLPRFMEHLEAVEVTGDRRSHWTAKGPAGTKAEWEAEVTEDRPGELIAWRSVEGSAVDTAGSVRFKPAPAGRGTEVRVELRYSPPGGALGKVVARLFGESPQQQVKSDLRRFKQMMETGQVLESDASIHRRPHPGQPAEDAP